MTLDTHIQGLKYSHLLHSHLLQIKMGAAGWDYVRLQRHKRCTEQHGPVRPRRAIQRTHVAKVTAAWRVAHCKLIGLMYVPM